MVKHIIIIVLMSLVMAGCASARHHTATVVRTVHDTLYRNKLQYDSVFIDNSLYTYREADTVYREKTRYEYKYKLLRDTLRIHKVDSIPVIREVEVVKEVPTMPWPCKLIVCMAILLLLVILMFNYKKLKQ